VKRRSFVVEGGKVGEIVVLRLFSVVLVYLDYCAGG